MDDINRYIKDIAKGILNVDGKKIKIKLLPEVQKKLESFKEYVNLYFWLLIALWSNVKEGISYIKYFIHLCDKSC